METQNRKPNRLSYYDYGEIGCYFVTLCTHNRQPLFGMEASNAKTERCNLDTNMVWYGPSAASNQIIHRWVAEVQNKYSNISVDQYVIMPDHVHLLVTLTDRQRNGSLSDGMRFFKTMTTNEYIRCVKQGLLRPFNGKLWQKSYYDHIIRNQQDYDEIWEYIENNPAKWMLIHGQLP